MSSAWLGVKVRAETRTSLDCGGFITLPALGAESGVAVKRFVPAL